MTQALKDDKLHSIKQLSSGSNLGQVFRYINAEKTVGGAKEYKKSNYKQHNVSAQKKGGNPIFEVLDESIRSSTEAPNIIHGPNLILNQDYFQR